MLVPVFAVALALGSASSLVGQLGSIAPLSPSSSSAGMGGALLLAGCGALVAHALLVLVDLVLCAGLAAVDRDGSVTAHSVLKAALRRPSITAAFARALFHLAMAFITLMTCGIGVVIWLLALMYIPLALPVAAREATGGIQALLRSANLLSWRPEGGPWYGTVDRVIVGYHAVAGISYALWTLPNLPLLAWLGNAATELLASGTMDPTVLQAGLTPPIWMGLPTHLLSTMVGVLGSAYSHQLFLDLHEDIVAAREGTDIHAALDRLDLPALHRSTGAPA